MPPNWIISFGYSSSLVALIISLMCSSQIDNDQNTLEDDLRFV